MVTAGRCCWLAVMAASVTVVVSSSLRRDSPPRCLSSALIEKTEGGRLLGIQALVLLLLSSASHGGRFIAFFFFLNAFLQWTNTNHLSRVSQVSPTASRVLLSISRAWWQWLKHKEPALRNFYTASSTRSCPLQYVRIKLPSTDHEANGVICCRALSYHLS